MVPRLVMLVRRFPDADVLAHAAGEHAAAPIRGALAPTPDGNRSRVDGLEQVRTSAVLIAPWQIRKAREIVSILADARRASGVSVEEPVRPASIGSRHPNAIPHVEPHSASPLRTPTLSRLHAPSAIVLES